MERLFAADRSAFLLPLPDGIVYLSENIESRYLKAYERRIENLGAGVIRYTENALERGHTRRRQLGLEVWSNDELWRIIGHPAEEWPVFHDHVKPAGIAHGRAISVCLDQGETYLGLAYSRPATDPFAEAEGVELLRMVLPAFKAGVHAVRRLFTERAALAEMLDTLREGLSLFDLAGREIHRNRPLAALLAADQERERLLRVMASVAASVARVRRPPGKSERDLPAPGGSQQVETTNGSYRIWGSYLGAGVLGVSDVVVVAVEPLTPALPPAVELQERYGLTPREAEVGLLLARGLSNAAIARRLRISAHTVRHHAERIFGKLRIRSRKALGLRLIDRSDGTA